VAVQRQLLGAEQATSAQKQVHIARGKLDWIMDQANIIAAVISGLTRRLGIPKVIHQAKYKLVLSEAKKLIFDLQRLSISLSYRLSNQGY
jgi:hypothetical protein